MRRLGFDSAADKNRSPIFGFNETLKNKFPVEKFLLIPEI